MAETFRALQDVREFMRTRDFLYATGTLVLTCEPIPHGLVIYNDLGRILYEYQRGHVNARLLQVLAAALAGVRGVPHPADPSKTCVSVALVHFDGDVAAACVRAVDIGCWFERIVVDSFSLPIVGVLPHTPPEEEDA